MEGCNILQWLLFNNFNCGGGGGGGLVVVVMREVARQLGGKVGMGREMPLPFFYFQHLFCTEILLDK